jgi:uncharacterized protein with beta-barrel porin domain
MKLEEHRTLFPWRIELAFMAYSGGSIQRSFLSISGYIDGYGLGGYPRYKLESLLSAMSIREGLGMKAR